MIDSVSQVPIGFAWAMKIEHEAMAEDGFGLEEP